MEHAQKTLDVTSSVLEEGSEIPSLYTCDGKDISPPLSWSNIPENTQSIAIISDDPDAPMGTWVHWVVFNLPPTVNTLSENASIKELGGVEGTTSFNDVGYGGPCPPSGVHRYYFKVYALDTKLDLDASARKEDVEQAISGHILAEGQLMGTYERKK